MKYGIYVHIPFCRQKCFYCDFPSVANGESLYLSYIEALCQEIYWQGAKLTGDVVDTVYIGGGTPTVLSSEMLAAVIAALQQSFTILPDAEITIEANPGTVDAAKLRQLHQIGVNRLSFGVQTFQTELLREIGRLHTAKQAISAVQAARRAGFSNISIDLMYGLPKQSLGDVVASVEQAMALAVEHISVYGLQVEAKTVFAKLQAAQQLVLPTEECEDAMYEYIMAVLPKNNYQRYEISNFAARGFVSRHNLKYWSNQPYIGIGAAAHSYRQPSRWANTQDVKQYIASLQQGKIPAELTEELDQVGLMEEFCFLALRTERGILFAEFITQFGCDIFSVYGQTIENLIKKKLLRQDAERISLTKLGMKYGNQVFGAFLLK